MHFYSHSKVRMLFEPQITLLLLAFLTGLYSGLMYHCRISRGTMVSFFPLLLRIYVQVHFWQVVLYKTYSVKSSVRQSNNYHSRTVCQFSGILIFTVCSEIRCGVHRMSSSIKAFSYCLSNDFSTPFFFQRHWPSNNKWDNRHHGRQNWQLTALRSFPSEVKVNKMFLIF